MPNFQNISFLCGYFSRDADADGADALVAAGWNPVEYSEQTERGYRNFFYSGFVDFFLRKGPGAPVRKFRKAIESTIAVGEHKATVQSLCLWLMPYGTALYSIEVRMESGDLNDFTWQLHVMRDCNRWDREEVQEFLATAIAPIREAGALIGNTDADLVEMGNKLKLFQIVTTEDFADFGANADFTLFELGTLGKIGGCSQNSGDSPSESYIRRLMEGNKLSFFRNWSGLALLDTFTMMGAGIKPWALESWQEDYFGMIYVHTLFCKFYLLKLNARFREHPEQGEKLEEEYHQFERLYTFHRISYNFLPQEIDEAMDKSLEITKETTLLRRYIMECNKQKAAESAGRLDKILTFLAIVTVFSTIWDFASLLDAMWPFSQIAGTAEAGFRFVTSATLLIIILVIIYILKPSRK